MNINRNLIFPEQLPDTPKRLRANKKFTVITTHKKEPPPVRWNHCRIHIGTKLIGGYLCEFCGTTLPAIRTVDVIPFEEKAESS
jgi:hypothetical protein